MQQGTDVSEQATEELTRLSQEVLNAIREKDGTALDRVLDDRFVHVPSGSQTQSRQQFVDSIVAATYTIEDIGFDSLRVEVRDDVGVVAGVQRARGHLPDGQEFCSVGAFTDVFRRTGDGWRLWLAHSVEVPSA